MIAGVLTAAMVMQYAYGEVPCPLCLLQRVAMFGICFGVMRHFRHGDRTRSIGLGLLSALALLVIAGRQVLLDICPLPGRSYVGSAVLGLPHAGLVGGGRAGDDRHLHAASGRGG